MKKIKHIPGVCMAVSVAVSLLLNSCSDFLALEAPKNQLVTLSIFTDNDMANGAMTGIYQEMNANFSTHFAGGGSGSVTQLVGLMADELEYHGTNALRTAFAASNLLPDDPGVLNLWAGAYKTIYRANAIMEGLGKGSNVSENLSLQLRGEALFVRAFCHFYLVNMFGDVPLVLTTDYRVTRLLPRDSRQEVYGAIVKDLEDALSMLPVDYQHAKGQRVRPNRWAAAALMARVFLYQEQWQAAASAADKVIGQAGLYAIERDAAKVFLKESDEAIWQILPINPLYDTYEGFEAIPAGTTASAPPLVATAFFLDQYEPGDRRRELWLSNYTPRGSTIVFMYPYKYKTRTKTTASPHLEYSMVLRLAEQYLIRAEARVRLGDTDGARQDLDMVRMSHGGLPATTATRPDELLSAIEKERMIEFMYEWGHRWFDLKRWGKAEAALSQLKSGWRPEAMLLPVPRKEMEVNINLKQNEGYE